MNADQSVDKVLSSQTFANKEVLKGLLKFLYDQSKLQSVLKETDIAIGYFKRRTDFIPGDDTIVRVNVYKLRILLEKYYAEEGQKDEHIITIPKGSYSIYITGKAVLHATKRNRKRCVARLLPALLIISLLINLFLLVRPQHTRDSLNNPIFSSYARDARPVFITLGDPFFFRIKDQSSTGGSLIVRDIGINSREELEQNRPHGREEVKSEISELNYPYFSRNNLWPLPGIIALFARGAVETRLQTLSESNIDDIKNNNVVFIANINSFGWMNKFMERTSYRLLLHPRRISIQTAKNNVVLSVPEFIKGSYNDYAFIVKIPGPNNNQITMMGDFHASGLRGLSGMISKKSSMEKLEAQVKKTYGHFPEYFEMLVKVTSYNYSDFDTRLIHFKSLE